jgi:hypothetical protein
MGRAILLLAVLYHWGDARFDAYRPAMLDRPLTAFHATADRAIVDARRTLAAVDDARSMRYLAPLLRGLGEP